MAILRTKWCRDDHPTRRHCSRDDHPKSYNMHEKIHGCLVFKCGVEGSPLLSVRCQEYAWRLCFSPKFKVQVLLNTEEGSQVIHTCYPAWALHCVRPLRIANIGILQTLDGASNAYPLCLVYESGRLLGPVQESRSGKGLEKPGAA